MMFENSMMDDGYKILTLHLLSSSLQKMLHHYCLGLLLRSLMPNILVNRLHHKLPILNRNDLN